MRSSSTMANLAVIQKHPRWFVKLLLVLGWPS
jgi:hypothetical protein